MSPFLIKAIQFFMSLSLIIVLHEGGHYVAARIFKTRVEKFFLFFDLKFSLFKKKIGDTVFGIGWIPLGGYVKISGMIDESMDKEQMKKPPEPWEFRSKPAWQRLIIMLGGVTVNIILGFVIFMMILFVWGKDYINEDSLPQGFAVTQTMKDLGFQDGDYVEAINGKPLQHMGDVNRHLLVRDVHSITAKHDDGTVETLAIPEGIGSTLFQSGEMQAFIPMPTTILDSVIPNSPASRAGLEKGDKIVSINGEKLKYYSKLNEIKKTHPNEALTIGYVSKGVKKQVKVTPDSDNHIGFYVKGNVVPQHQSFGLGESISHGFSYTYWTLHDYVAQFKFIFSKKGATQLGGFGTIGGLFPDAWNWQRFWSTTAFISIILAFMNILPIPALDGGHVMFLLYEMVSGRKPNEKVMEYAQMIGIIILLALVLYANGNDVYRYFFK